jgi:hypothetical protein
MERQKVKSTNLHSVGHDPTGLEVAFHARTCPAREDPARCNCEGGDVWHYAGVEKDHHTAMLNIGSPGAYFHSRIRAATDTLGNAKYPGTKR